MGILAKIDHAKLGIYCQAMSDIHAARTMIRKFGQVIKQDGRLQQSPWVRIQNAAEVKVYKFASDFGFSPSDRMRLSVYPLDEEDEKDKKFFG